MPGREDVRTVAAREDVRSGQIDTGATAGRTRGASHGDWQDVPEAEVPLPRYAETSARRRASRDGDERLANGLGWFSIGLGLAEVVAPRNLARLIGVPEDPRYLTMMRVMGLREIATGLGILSRERPAGWLKARVAGDVLDLALLGAAMRSDDSENRRVAAATAAVLGVTALDVIASGRLSEKPAGRTGAQFEGRAQVHKSITIRKSPEELYSFWRDFENLPQFMYHLESVEVHGSGRSHWVAKAPAGARVEWDAEIVDDRANELISWRSVADADVRNSGTVRFVPAPGNRGTEIHVDLSYDPPAGKLGVLVAKLFGEEPSQQVGDDLRRLKQVMEVGEVVRSEGNLEGQGRPYLAQRAAKHPETATTLTEDTLR